MRIIGITGGVGSGKSTVLAYLRSKYHAVCVEADRAAEELILPDGACYGQVIALLGNDVLSEDGKTIDRRKMAQILFHDQMVREQINRIIHPAVRSVILEKIEEARTGGEGLFILEAALLIEENYDKVCDELWYIYAGEDVRETRLMKSRGYSKEKIRAIIGSQRTEEEFRRACRHTVNNSGDEEQMHREIDRLLCDLSE